MSLYQKKQNSGLHNGNRSGLAKYARYFLAMGVVLFFILIVASRLDELKEGGFGLAAPTGFQAIKTIIDQRCVHCHGEAVQMKNIRLDTSDSIKTHAQGIYQQVVVTRQMPMNNATEITEDERAMIGRWFSGGAKIQ